MSLDDNCFFCDVEFDIEYILHKKTYDVGDKFLCEDCLESNKCLHCTQQLLIKPTRKIREYSSDDLSHYHKECFLDHNKIDRNPFTCQFELCSFCHQGGVPFHIYYNPITKLGEIRCIECIDMDVCFGCQLEGDLIDCHFPFNINYTSTLSHTKFHPDCHKIMEDRLKVLGEGVCPTCDVGVELECKTEWCRNKLGFCLECRTPELCNMHLYCKRCLDD
jgi:hypothetical protein